MRFSLLLFALGLILKTASFTNRAFKWYIRKSKIRILVKTKDGRRARLFIFNRGKVSSKVGDCIDYDAALVFRDANTGFKILTSKKNDASFNAAANGDFHVEGMSFYAQWFQDGTDLVL